MSFPLACETWWGGNHVFLSLHAVRFLADVQRSIQHFFGRGGSLLVVLSSQIPLKHDHRINLPKLHFILHCLCKVWGDFTPTWWISGFCMLNSLDHYSWNPGLLWSDLCSSNFVPYSSPIRTLSSTGRFLAAKKVTRLHCCCLTLAYTLLPPWNAAPFVFCLPSFNSCAPRSHHRGASTPWPLLSVNCSCLCVLYCTGWHCVVDCATQFSTVSRGLALDLCKTRSFYPSWC